MLAQPHSLNTVCTLCIHRPIFLSLGHQISYLNKCQKGQRYLYNACQRLSIQLKVGNPNGSRKFAWEWQNVNWRVRGYVFYLIKILSNLQVYELNSHHFHNINNNITILLIKCDVSYSWALATHITLKLQCTSFKDFFRLSKFQRFRNVRLILKSWF